MQLPTPSQLKSQYPLLNSSFVKESRHKACQIVKREDARLAAIVGPCSIHDPESALAYATLLKKLSPSIEESFFPVMRVFVEKPRTRIGWKGLLYDPHLDGSHDIALGLRMTRKLMLEILALEIPIAAELLDPIIVPYFDDLVVWGFIGARTSASQPHRQMASHLSFPVGFKNDCQGRFDEAIAAVSSSRVPHSYVGINEEGRVSSIHSKGNPLSHLVLRGSDTSTNYDTASINLAMQYLEQHGIEPSLLIDCSHGNCNKDHKRQGEVFLKVIEQAATNRAIAGVMLESHLFEGKQLLTENLKYGVSITDSCIGWEETQGLLLTSMSFVQS